jgi:hypothetical protein
MYHRLSRVKTGGDADHLLAIPEPIGWNEASLLDAASFPCPLPLPCYKLLEIERVTQLIGGRTIHEQAFLSQECDVGRVGRQCCLTPILSDMQASGTPPLLSDERQYIIYQIIQNRTGG